ncbi:MAG: hypothetical protein ACLUN9_22005 [Enterocloster aldenensis]
MGLDAGIMVRGRKAGPEPPARNRWQDVTGTESLAEGSGPEPLTKNCGYRYRLPGKRFTGQPVCVSFGVCWNIAFRRTLAPS